MIDAFGPFLALRYLLTRRINLLGVVGVMFAVWAILVVDSVFTGFVSQIRTDVRNGSVDLMITGLPHDTGYAPLRDALAADDAVVQTAPRLRHHGLLQPLRPPRHVNDRGSAQLDFDHTENGFALLIGIDPIAEEAVGQLRTWLARGPEELALRGGSFWPSPVLDSPDPERRRRLLLPDADEWRARGRANLPRDTLERHRSSMPGVLFGSWRVLRTSFDRRPGEPFELLCASYTGPEGAAQLHTDSLRVAFAGCFATGHRTVDENVVLLPIETLRSLLGHDPFDDGIDLVTDVALRVRDGLTPDELAAAKVRLQQRAQQVLPPGSPPCLCVDWEEQNVVFLSAVAHEQGMMQFVLFVVMLVAAFVIYATLHMMVTQKVKDIGIMAAVGGAPRSIGAVFLIGGLTVALVGTALGVGLGVWSALELNTVNDWLYAKTGLELFPRTMFDLREVPCRLEPSWVATVAIGAVVLALVVAFLPARKAARLDPVQALAHE